VFLLYHVNHKTALSDIYKSEIPPAMEKIQGNRILIKLDYILIQSTFREILKTFREIIMFC